MKIFLYLPRVGIRVAWVIGVLLILIFPKESIGQSVTVTSPNTNVIWQSATNQTITWTGAGPANVRIEFSSNNGSSWTLVGTQSLSTLSYPWTVPQIQGGSTQCLFRISDALNPLVFDISDVTFTIPPSVILNYPNGSETLYGGTVRGIRWTHDPSVSTVRLEYSSDNGSTWNTIVSSVRALQKFYAWTIPSINSSNVIVRASNATNSIINDVSDQVLTVTTNTLVDPVRYRGGAYDGYSMRSNLVPAITVTSPNTNVFWQANTTQVITWTSANVDNVLIEYSTNNGSAWTTILTSPASTGYYNWNVPQIPGGSTACLIKITDILNSGVTDQSDVTFTIPPSIIVDYPNGSETFYAGTIRGIRWTHDPSVSNVLLEYSTKGGTSWNVIVSSVRALQKF